jgi:hypothetical protein
MVFRALLRMLASPAVMHAQVTLSRVRRPRSVDVCCILREAAHATSSRSNHHLYQRALPGCTSAQLQENLATLLRRSYSAAVYRLWGILSYRYPPSGESHLPPLPQRSRVIRAIAVKRLKPRRRPILFSVEVAAAARGRRRRRGAAPAARQRAPRRRRMRRRQHAHFRGAERSRFGPASPPPIAAPAPLPTQEGSLGRHTHPLPATTIAAQVDADCSSRSAIILSHLGSLQKGLGP